MAKPSTADLQYEVTLVSLLIEDWKRRGSPGPEGMVLQDRRVRAETALANAKATRIPTLDELRHEVDIAKALIEDWKRRGGPNLEVEGTALATRLHAALSDLASAQASAPRPTQPATAQPATAQPPTAQPSKYDIDNETNARFWLQTPGAKVLQPLNPKNPTDRALMPIWMNTLHRVQQEARDGKLVITYNKPAVIKSLNDAALAQKAAALHATIAVKTPDPRAAQDNTAAATTATQIATLKKEEGAAQQPPTVSPKLVDEAADKAARNPPPPHAPAEDQIAHAQTQTPPQNGQFLRPEDDPWDQERYVPPGAPTTRQPPPPMRQPPQPPMRRPPPPGAATMRQPRPPPTSPTTSPTPSRPAGGPVAPGAPGTPTPTPTPTPATPSTSDSAPSPTKTVSPPPEEESSIGTYLAIGFLALVGGATIYYVAKRKSSPSKSSSPRALPPRALPPRTPRAARSFPASSETLSTRGTGT